MPTFEQLPAVVDLALVSGDRLPFNVVFDADLTGYTFDASVIDSQTKAVTISATTAATAAASSTTLSVDFADTSTANLSATGQWSWYLRWKPSGGGWRTVLAGTAKVQKP